MITLMLNSHDTHKSMVDLVTGDDTRNDVWGSFHIDMLHDSNAGRLCVEGIKTPYEALREDDSVECVILTIEEFNAILLGKPKENAE